MKILVEEVVGGWVVVGGSTMGPFQSKRRAIELAEGMVTVLKSHGEIAELFVDGAAAPEANLPGCDLSSSAA